MQVLAPLQLAVPEHPAERGGLPVLRLSTQQAAELGLQQGQVVRGVVDERGGQLSLHLLDGRFQTLPVNGSAYRSASFWFQVEFTPYGVYLKARPAAGPAAAPASVNAPEHDRGGLDPLRYLTNLASVMPASGHRDFARLQQLLRQVPDPDLLQAVEALQLQSKQLEGLDIQRALAMSGLFAALRPANTPDLRKVLLLLQKYLRVDGDNDGAAEDDLLHAVSNQLDSARLETLVARMGGELHYRFMLLMADQQPVEIVLQRRGGDKPDEPRYFLVELNVQLAPDLPVSFSCMLDASNRLALSAWLPDAQFAGQLREQVPVLREQLEDHGMELGACTIFDHARPGPSHGREAIGTALEVRI
jgi:hypothetical protein